MIYLKLFKRTLFTYIRIFYYKFFVSKAKKKKFITDLKKFEKKIKKKKNFAFSRFSDGELFVLQNKKLVISKNYWLLDKKKTFAKFSKDEQKTFLPNKHQFYRKKLYDSLKFKKKNYYKGIACRCCNGLKNVKFMKQIGNDDNNLTFSNLLQNGNYPYFIRNFIFLFKKREIIIISNKAASTINLPFKVKKKFNIGINCFINDYHIIKKLKNYIKKYSIKNHIFLISASSLSNLIVYELFKEFDNNTFIDVGSTLNYYNDKKKIQSRSYLSEYWCVKHNNIEYLNRYCYW